MMVSPARFLWRSLCFLLGLGLLALRVTPLLGLLLSSSPSEWLAGTRHPLFLPALWLSFRTTLCSLFLVILMGTPLAWWLSTHSGKTAQVVTLLTTLPMVIPPAVVGVALLQMFGQQGLLGPLLKTLQWQVPFSTTAVVLAQVVISAPFYIQSATSAFRRIDLDLLLVARTLGQSPAGTFFRVVLPLALPGLLGGAVLAWGRALGEFGATLLFAGNLAGKTQTMPLAIYTALESDVRTALALSLFLAGFAILLLVSLRFLPTLFAFQANRTSREGNSNTRKERT